MAKVSPSIFSTVNQFFVTSPPLFFLSYYTVSASATGCIPNTVGAVPKYQMTLCQRPSVRRKTLPLVVNLFFGILLPPFFNHQHYSKGLTYVQLNVPNRAEKKLSAFWWFYTYLGQGVFSRPFSLFIAAQFLRWGALIYAEEKKRIFRGGAGLSPALCARLDSQALCLPCRKQENSPTPIVTPYRMASLWENLAFTTPSLTPRPQNRPLKIGKLTPCKIPGVAGSAGHCEPG